jgi:hypothetical protein
VLLTLCLSCPQERDRAAAPLSFHTPCKMSLVAHTNLEHCSKKKVFENQNTISTS